MVLGDAIVKRVKKWEDDRSAKEQAEAQAVVAQMVQQALEDFIERSGLPASATVQPEDTTYFQKLSDYLKGALGGTNIEISDRVEAILHKHMADRQPLKASPELPPQPFYPDKPGTSI